VYDQSAFIINMNEHKFTRDILFLFSSNSFIIIQKTSTYVKLIFEHENTRFMILNFNRW